MNLIMLQVHMTQNICGRCGNASQIVRTDVQQIIDTARIQMIFYCADTLGTLPVVVKRFIAPASDRAYSKLPQAPRERLVQTESRRQC